MVFTQDDPCVAAEFIADLARGEINRPADGVAAKQRALRPAQDLDLLEVEDIEHRSDAAAEVNPIDVDADARVGDQGKVVLPHAADKNHRRGIGA